MEYFKNRLLSGLSEETSVQVAFAIDMIAIILLCLIVQFIVKKVVLKLITHYVNTNKYNWDNIMLDHKVFDWLSRFAPPIIIYSFAPIFEGYKVVIQRMVLTYVFVLIIFVFNSILDAIDDIYRNFPVSKVRPIKGLIQVVKIVLYIIIGILIIANLLGERPLALLSGIGALTAVFSLVFKDSILGFVAGIQLTSNNMLRIGDWIEMPKYGADGDVIEITLNTVKVQNFDKTIVTIPAYSLVSDSFKNWRGMQQSGGRRIKRAIYIDVASICFCTEAMIETFKRIEYLKDYIQGKEIEMDEFNKSKDFNLEHKVNGRHLTNLGTFRAYIQNYIKHHPKVHQDMTQMVRQLPSGEHGVPLEVYAFTNEIKWEVYEGIQSDIFDHILAVAGEFGLRIFQNPTGHDFKQLGK